jgi:hypothetical protein
VGCVDGHRTGAADPSHAARAVTRDLSLGYCAVLLIGFLLWIAYGLTTGNLALVIPNSVALAVGMALMLVALQLRRPLARTTRPRADRRARIWRTRI